MHRLLSAIFLATNLTLILSSLLLLHFYHVHVVCFTCLLLLAMVKQTSLTSAKSVVGTCPDMCPEKERYRREDTRRLSWFEIDRSTYEPGVGKMQCATTTANYIGQSGPSVDITSLIAH